MTITKKCMDCGKEWTYEVKDPRWEPMLPIMFPLCNECNEKTMKKLARPSKADQK